MEFIKATFRKIYTLQDTPVKKECKSKQMHLIVFQYLE